MTDILTSRSWVDAAGTGLLTYSAFLAGSVPLGGLLFPMSAAVGFVVTDGIFMLLMNREKITEWDYWRRTLTNGFIVGLITGVAEFGTSIVQLPAPLLIISLIAGAAAYQVRAMME